MPRKGLFWPSKILALYANQTGTIGALAYHPMNQMGVGGTIGTLAYHPMNQMGVGGTIGTLAYHPMNQTGVGGTIGTLAYHPMNQKIPHMYTYNIWINS